MVKFKQSTPKRKSKSSIEDPKKQARSSRNQASKA
jgi:hypothetical protein